MILADTSVWIDHFRWGSKEMANALHQGQILMHPCITTELALGYLQNRTKTLSMLDLLPQARVAQFVELRLMIESRHLFNLGIDLTDAHLIASVFLSPGTSLWSRDKRLRAAALHLGIQADLL